MSIARPHPGLIQRTGQILYTLFLGLALTFLWLIVIALVVATALRTGGVI